MDAVGVPVGCGGTPRVRRHCGLRIAVCFDFYYHRHGDHGRARRRTKTACANRLVRNVMKAVTALRGFGVDKLRYIAKDTHGRLDTYRVASTGM